MERLAICAIFRNEGPYLLEWIRHHLCVGFDHFVLYDNLSTDDGAARIAASDVAPHVDVVPWPHQPGQQTSYRDFIANHATRFDWAAFIDLDEFIVPLETVSVRDLLIRYGGFSAVLLNWLVFGPSGHDRRPEGGMIENYTQRLPEAWDVNRHVKTLARTRDLLDIGANVHVFALRYGPCDALSRPVPNIALQVQPCHERLVINHYFTRSRQDWEVKLKRGPADTVLAGQLRYPMDLFDHIADAATVPDNRIRRFQPPPP
jgi:O-antigen biosynthesis protein